jgi:hypothetical protein
MQTNETMALATGYGDIIAAFEGTRLIEQQARHAQAAPLDPDLAGTFGFKRYCQIVARSLPHLYRLVDETKQPNPQQLQLPQAHRAGYYLLRSRDPRGAWMSLLRPTILSEYRRYTAIKSEWNLAHAVIDCILRAGALVYVGRAGPQADERQRRLLHGGAVQVWLPANQFYNLSFNCWWVPE